MLLPAENMKVTIQMPIQMVEIIAMQTDASHAAMTTV